ncbi:hypothetical protein K439DRAFT_1619957 [Ramaria rubella]|nr:hypothetical protein K439DRAFT_1619957 [Ramaria rubella]
MASFSSPEPTFHASLTVRKAKAVRAWAFPNEVNQESHTAYLSLEHIEDWLQHNAYQLFVWSEQQPPGGSRSGIGESFVADSPIGRLKAYRDMQHEYWSLENAEVWIKWVPFEAYLEWFRTVHPNQLSGSFTVGPAKAAKGTIAPPPTRADSPLPPSSPPISIPSSPVHPSIRHLSPDSVIIVSSDDEDFSPSQRPLPSERSSSPMFVDSGSSDDFKVFEQELRAKRRSTIAQSASHPDSPIIISSDPPELTRPCKKRKAITLSSSDFEDGPSHKRACADKGIRLTTKKTVAKIERLTTIPKVWAVPRDNTTYLLDLSEDPDKLCKPDGTTRTIDSLIRVEDHESWAGSSGSKRGDTWVQNALGDAPVRCRTVALTCNGINTCELFDANLIRDCERFEPDENERRTIWDAAKVQNQKEAEDVNAIVARFFNIVMGMTCKLKGCAGGPVMKIRKKMDSIIYVSIPANVDESELKLAMETGHLREPVTVNPMCTFNVHPRVGNKKYCHFTHVIDGKIVRAKINKERKCPTWLTVFVPVDPTIHKVVLIFCKPHNHPMHLMDKATPDQCVLLEKVMNVAGPVPLSVKKLSLAPSTYAALNGTALGESCPGFVNSQWLQDAIKEIHERDYPKGFGWEGLQLECIRDASLPPEKCYIHSVVFRGQVHVAVTMHPAIGKYIHNVQGSTNTWEVAGFLETLGKLKNVTGKELKILVIHKDGALWCIIVDAEPAQIQGLGDVLLMLNLSVQSHYELGSKVKLRNVEGLSKDVPHEEIEHLKSFMGLKSHHEIAEWHWQCIASPYKAVKDWYQNKIMHPWYLPSVNAFLFKIPKDSWKITPNHSNLVESAHAGWNADTQIGASALTAVIAFVFPPYTFQNWPIAKRQGIWQTYEMGFLSVNNVQYNVRLGAVMQWPPLLKAHEEIEKLEHERHEAKEKHNAWDDHHKRITQEMSENVQLKGTRPIVKPLEFTASANNKENDVPAPSAGIRNLSIKPNVVDNVSLSDPPLDDGHHIPQDAISCPLHPTFTETSFDVHKQLHHSPIAIASSSATTLDTLAAFKESHFNELVEFFADPSVMKLMEGGDYRN